MNEICVNSLFHLTYKYLFFFFFFFFCFEEKKKSSQEREEKFAFYFFFFVVVPYVCEWAWSEWESKREVCICMSATNFYDDFRWIWVYLRKDYFENKYIQTTVFFSIMNRNLLTARNFFLEIYLMIFLLFLAIKYPVVSYFCHYCINSKCSCIDYCFCCWTFLVSW